MKLISVVWFCKLKIGLTNHSFVRKMCCARTTTWQLTNFNFTIVVVFVLCWQLQTEQWFNRLHAQPLSLLSSCSRKLRSQIATYFFFFFVTSQSQWDSKFLSSRWWWLSDPQKKKNPSQPDLLKVVFFGWFESRIIYQIVKYYMILQILIWNSNAMLLCATRFWPPTHFSPVNLSIVTILTNSLSYTINNPPMRWYGVFVAQWFPALSFSRAGWSFFTMRFVLLLFIITNTRVQWL